MQADIDRLKGEIKTQLAGVFDEIGSIEYAAPRVAQGAFFDVDEFAPFKAAILELRAELQAGEPDVAAFSPNRRRDRTNGAGEPGAPGARRSPP